MIKNYSIIGLGKLGASMAAAIAMRGFNVIGVDINQRAVDAINTGRAPVQETNLQEMIASNRERLMATRNHRDAILNSDVTFVIVPTPSDERGAFSLQFAAWAFREIGQALADKQGYHNVVLTSTVLPGATRHGLLPILARESGKVAGRDFGLCYSPEFIALGSVIHDFLNPDFTLIGQIDERAGTNLESCYAQIMTNNPLCQRMSLENAELTKVAVNAFITTKITFANMLADLCERIPGGDVDVVTNALGSDKRIGHRYLKGALGYGGPCFPRDNLALGFLARALGTRAELSETTDSVNRSLPSRFMRDLLEQARPGITVAVLGLAYKPYSHVIEESQGIALARSFAKAGVRVVAYDPLANMIAQNELKDQVVIVDSIDECVDQADIILITTPDPAFQVLEKADFYSHSCPVLIMDFWRVLSLELMEKANVNYVPVGRSKLDDDNATRLIQLWGSVGQVVQ